MANYSKGFWETFLSDIVINNIRSPINNSIKNKKIMTTTKKLSPKKGKPKQKKELKTLNYDSLMNLKCTTVLKREETLEEALPEGSLILIFEDDGSVAQYELGIELRKLPCLDDLLEEFEMDSSDVLEAYSLEREDNLDGNAESILEYVKDIFSKKGNERSFKAYFIPEGWHMDDEPDETEENNA